MTRLAIDALLVAVVLATWLGCIGFARLHDPLDRLHCASFVNAVAGILMAAIGLLADGLSTRSGKMLVIAAVGILVGAAVSHAAARALVQRRVAPGASDTNREGASGAGLQGAQGR